MPATPVGWQNFTNVLLNPNSVLRELFLTGNVINDDIMSAFASVLTNNNRLRKLNFGIYGGNFGQITSVGYAAFSRMLCEEFTLLNAYNSNHTLTDTGLTSFWGREDTNYIYVLLSIIDVASIRQAARIKIIRSHFRGSDINTQVFTEMNLSVLPNAIAWMGHNNGSHGGRYLRRFEFLEERATGL